MKKSVNVINLINELLYHYTSVNNVSLILSQGLLPRALTNNLTGLAYDGKISQKDIERNINYVYLTEHGDAWKDMDPGLSLVGINPALRRLSIRNFQFSTLENDPEFFNDGFKGFYITTDVIPPEYISLHSSGIPNKFQVELWRDFMLKYRPIKDKDKFNAWVDLKISQLPNSVL